MEKGPKDKEPDTEPTTQEIEQELERALIALSQQDVRASHTTPNASSSSSSAGPRKKARILSSKQQTLRTETLEMLDIFFRQYANQNIPPEVLGQETILVRQILEKYYSNAGDLNLLSTPDMAIAHRAIAERNPVVLEILLSLQPSLLRSKKHPLRFTPLQFVLSQGPTDALFLQFLIITLKAAVELRENTIYREVIKYSDDITLKVLLYKLARMGFSYSRLIVERLLQVNKRRVNAAIAAAQKQIQLGSNAEAARTLIDLSLLDQANLQQEQEVRQLVEQLPIFPNNTNNNSNNTINLAQNIHILLPAAPQHIFTILTGSSSSSS